MEEKSGTALKVGVGLLGLVLVISIIGPVLRLVRGIGNLPGDAWNAITSAVGSAWDSFTGAHSYYSMSASEGDPATIAAWGTPRAGRWGAASVQVAEALASWAFAAGSTHTGPTGLGSTQAARTWLQSFMTPQATAQIRAWISWAAAQSGKTAKDAASDNYWLAHAILAHYGLGSPPNQYTWSLAYIIGSVWSDEFNTPSSSVAPHPPSWYGVAEGH